MLTRRGILFGVNSDDLFSLFLCGTWILYRFQQQCDCQSWMAISCGKVMIHLIDRFTLPPSKLRRRSRPFSLRDEEEEEEEDAAHTRGKMWPSHLLFAAAQKPATLSAIMTRARQACGLRKYYAKCASVRGRPRFLPSFWQKGSLNAGEKPLHKLRLMHWKFYLRYERGEGANSINLERPREEEPI